MSVRGLWANCWEFGDAAAGCGGGKRDARRWWGVRCVRDDVRGSGDCTCGMVGEEGGGVEGVGLTRPVRRGGDDGVCFEKGRAGELGDWAL